MMNFGRPEGKLSLIVRSVTLVLNSPCEECQMEASLGFRPVCRTATLETRQCCPSGPRLPARRTEIHHRRVTSPLLLLKSTPTVGSDAHAARGEISAKTAYCRGSPVRSARRRPRCESELEIVHKIEDCACKRNENRISREVMKW